jgi:sugar O-acyltransferase (sialic acid O-acetyltransferase NeuD family)
MHVLRVPLLNANEEEVEVVDVSTHEGAEVRAGDRLFVVESTKATVEVEAPVAGFVRKLAVAPGQRVRVQATMCVLTATATEPVDAADGAVAATGVRATRKAEELAARHGIDLASLGVAGIIKEADVERAIPRAPRARAGAPLVAAPGTRPVLVYGASGHARVLVDLMRLGGALTPVAAVDDGDADEVLGVPVIGTSADLERLRGAGYVAALGIGSVQHHARRVRYWEQLAGYELPNLVHPRAVVEPSVKMGAGNQVFAGAIIGSAAVLGDDTIVNSGTVVSHDCVIGSHTHVSPGAILAGGVHVGEGTLIGMGVTIYLGVRVGRDVMIANGVHIMKDVPDGAIVRAQS